ncbi:MAG TPA: hypothetical protein VGZ22_26220 [Isosphaeraceae bacterium]|jgi:hypothetical protein|nr:hypothetical protein [Isosphaeraceae bacterium]
MLWLQPNGLHPNEMTAAPCESYTYEAEGNLIGKTDTGTSSTWKFTWDDRNPGRAM